MINFARRRLNRPRGLAAHRPPREHIEALPDDARALAHLDEPHQITIVDVAVLTDGYREIHIRIGGVGLRPAEVPLHPRCAEDRPRQPVVEGVRGRNDADPSRALEPDAVLGQQRLVVVHPVREKFDELPGVVEKFLRNVLIKPAEAEGVHGEPRSEGPLEQIENHLPLPETPQKNRHRADVERVGGQPEKMARDPRKLGHDGADEKSAVRNLPVEERFDRLDPGQIARGGGDVIEPIRIGDEHRVCDVLSDLLGAPVEVADIAIDVLDRLAVELEDNPEHPVRAGVLGPHVDDEFLGAGDGAGPLNPGRDFRSEHQGISRFNSNKSHAAGRRRP